MTVLDDEKSTTFTQNLLNQYENDEISSSQLKQAVLEKCAKVINE